MDGTEGTEMAVWGQIRVERGREEKYHEGQFGDLSVDICPHPKMVKLSKGGG